MFGLGWFVLDLWVVVVWVGLRWICGLVFGWLGFVGGFCLIVMVLL